MGQKDSNKWLGTGQDPRDLGRFVSVSSVTSVVVDFTPVLDRE